jgi:uncharacterized membrane protein
VKVLDGTLNVYFAFLVILFVTGGYVPGAGYPERSAAVEMWRMGPWVTGFLALTLLRRLADRQGTFGRIAFVRLLGAAAGELTARPRAVYLITAVWIVLLFAVAARQLWAFGYSPDLEVFDQALWNTTQGRFYRSSLTGDANLLSEHFDPLHLLLVGFYFVHPTPLILLGAQAIMLGLGAIPVYWLARERFPGSVLAPLFAVLYLLYLPIREANRFGYHPGTLVSPLFLFALYFMEKSRWAPMLCFLALAGLLKENMPIAGAAIGIYLLVTGRQRILGGAMALAFGLWFYAGFAWIIPAFGPLSGGYKYVDLFTRLAPTPSGIFLAPFLNPTGLATSLASHFERKLEYLLDVFGPLAFLSLLSPSGLFLAAPFLAPHLLTDVRFLTTVRTHHTADLTPFVFCSAIWGVANFLRWASSTGWRGRRWERESVARAVAVALLSFSFLLHRWPESFLLRRFALTPHLERLHALLRDIPPGASVSTQRPISLHLAHRRGLYHFPDLGPAGREPADFVLLDRALLVRYTQVGPFEEGLAGLPGKGYEKIREEDSILLFRRATPRAP